METIVTPPNIKLEVLEQVEQPETGFLRVKRSRVVFHYPDESKSEPFTLDHIVRQGTDAVVIIAHYFDRGEAFVYLRSAIRPAVALTDYSQSKLFEESEVGNLWELPAGIIESSEIRAEGVLLAGVRELREEVGFEASDKDIQFLGKRVFSAVGLAGERLFFVEVEVDPTTRKIPSEDGSPFERGGVVTAVRLKDALRWIDEGLLPDSKTEIGLKRIGKLYGLV